MFDEGRTSARLVDFSNSFNNYTFISERKSNYEKFLSKNKELFLNVNLFKNIDLPNYNILSTLTNSYNFIFLNIPFLLSNRSDSAKYL